MDYALMAERADRAADYIEEGWTKHTLEDDTHHVCAIGALNKSTTGNARIGPEEASHSFYLGTSRSREDDAEMLDEIARMTLVEMSRPRWWRTTTVRYSGRSTLISYNDHMFSGAPIARAMRRVAKKLRKQIPPSAPVPAELTQKDMDLAGGPTE